MPRAISDDNNYAIWGPRACGDSVLVPVGVPLPALQAVFGSVQQAAVVRCSYCVPQENGVPVYVGSKPRETLAAAWPGWRSIG